MSLILDALRKLERDKDPREPGVLVVGAVPWGAPTRSRRPLLLALAGIGLVVLLAVALWRLSRRPAPAAPAPPVSVVPVTPASTPAPLPPPAPSPSVTASRPAAAPRPAPTPPAARPEPVPVPAAPGPVTPARETRAEDESARPSAPVQPPAAGTLRLNAISQRDGRPVALINDRLLFEGDSFDGVKVLRIGEAEVEVEVHGKRRVLRF